MPLIITNIETYTVFFDQFLPCFGLLCEYILSARCDYVWSACRAQCAATAPTCDLTFAGGTVWRCLHSRIAFTRGKLFLNSLKYHHKIKTISVNGTSVWLRIQVCATLVGRGYSELAWRSDVTRWARHMQITPDPGHTAIFFLMLNFAMLGVKLVQTSWEIILFGDNLIVMSNIQKKSKLLNIKTCHRLVKLVALHGEEDK